MYCNTTIQSQTYYFCLKFLKRLFYINSLYISKKTTSAILSSQSTMLDRALRLVNDLSNAMDEDKISVLLLLDLSAVFDTINHQILLSSFETVFGIHPTISSGFDHTIWIEISLWLSTILLPLHLPSCLVFHRAQYWDLCCLFCTLLHFQTL